MVLKQRNLFQDEENSEQRLKINIFHIWNESGGKIEAKVLQSNK